MEGKAGRKLILGPDDDEITFDPESAVTLASGQSLLTGGYIDEQGRRAFTLITPSLVPRDDGGSWVMVQSVVFSFNARQLEASGFGTLVTHREDSDPQADLWSANEAKDTYKTLPQGSVKSRPTQFLEAGQKGWVEIAREHDAEIIVMAATPLPDGGFVIQTGWRHSAKSPPLTPGGGGFNAGNEPRRKL